MQEHLRTEETFTKFLNTLTCSGCSLFINKECTHENKEEHNKEKAELKKCFEDQYIEQWKVTPPPVSKAREEMLNNFKIMAGKIDEAFVCTDYEPRTK